MPATAYPKHQAALAAAYRDLRAGVHEEPWGSNTSGRIREMQAHTNLGGSYWPWCVAADLTWKIEGGLPTPYRGASAYGHAAWARKTGWLVPLVKAIPGDTIIFRVGSGHDAMLASPWRPGQQVHTIDGNSSDRVKENWRFAGLVYAAIHYPEKAVNVPAAKPAVFEVVTSESGHKVIYVSGARAIGRKISEILHNHPHGVVIRDKRPAARRS